MFNEAANVFGSNVKLSGIGTGIKKKLFIQNKYRQVTTDHQLTNEQKWNRKQTKS